MSEVGIKCMLQGMPGTKFPDALLLVPHFPPNREVIQAFLDCGYYFRYGYYPDLFYIPKVKKDVGSSIE